MPTFTLHFAPDTCARVPLIALEKIGCPYRIEIVAFAKGQRRAGLGNQVQRGWRHRGVESLKG
jgi:hypothetical protein